MGIRFRCHHCETELHVKDFQAGKRGRCPECKGKFRIPLRDAAHSLEADDSSTDDAAAPAMTESTKSSQATGSAASAIETQRPRTKAVSQPSTSASSARDSSPAQPPVPVKPQALIEAPNAKWFVRPTTGGQYGPAPSESMWQWLGENRIGNDSLVWCEGWPEWLVAGEVFNDYFASCAAAESLSSDAHNSSTERADHDTRDSEVKNSTNVQSLPTPTLSDRNRATRKHRRRRNYIIMIAVLSVVMISLIVALAVVLSNQSG